MILDHLASQAAGPDRSPSANGLSRRSFLQAGAAAGGGLMLSLQPAVRKRRSRSGRRRWLRAQRLHPHRARRADRPDHALCRDGPGHLHLDPDADRRRAGGGPRSRCGSSTRRPTKSSTPIRLLRRAGDRQLERDPRGVAAAAPGRRDRANHAGGGGGQALERRSGVLPRAKRRSAARADGTTHQIWRACRRCGPHAGPRKRGAQATAGFQADRHAGQAARHAGEGQRNGRLRHRRPAAGREDRDARAIAGLRRPREERGRCGGQGRQGRAPDRAARRCRRRRGRPHGRREERAGGPRRSNGTTVRTPSSTPPRSSRELEQATLNPGAVAQNIGDADRAMAGAVTKVEAIYQVPFLAHATMEPMNCTVHVRKDGCEIWVGSQALARVQAAAAKTAGLPLDKVVVHNHLIGGGFGRRLESRRRHSRRRDRQAGRRSGEGRVDPRGGHPARHVSALLVRPAVRRPRCRKASRSPGPIASPAPRSLRDGCRRRSTTASIPTPPRARSIWSMRSRTCTSSMCGWSRRAFRPRSGAASGRRTTSS